MQRRPTTTGLDRRRREILEAVVRLNIETGRPVSSGLVERCLQRAVSSATIRTEMKNLEEAGYLDQPHTSAGRTPTDAGFRVFVDGLRAGWALRRYEAPKGMRDQVHRDLRRSLDRQDRWKSVAGLLSRLTENISIIVGPARVAARVERVDVYPRAAGRGLMVVILDTAQVRTGLIDLPAGVPAHVVAEAARLLSERVSGRTLAEIRAENLAQLSLVSTPVTECADRMARAGRELLTAPATDEVEVDGVGQVLEDPALQEPHSLRALVRFLESPHALGESLRAASARQQDGMPLDGFRVWIGRENPIGELRSFSVLTGAFVQEGRPGLLAVLGPRRMSYQRAFHGIDLVREALGGDPGPVAS